MMRTFTDDQIVQALTVLQATCKECSCKECPLGNDSGDCQLQLRVPAHYSINNVNVIWRALKSTTTETFSDSSHT